MKPITILAVALKKQGKLDEAIVRYREAVSVKPYDWIRTAADQSEFSQQEFYRHCEIVLQPMDSTENWPRIGLEAMASGSVLIVDNRMTNINLSKRFRHGCVGENRSEAIFV